MSLASLATEGVSSVSAHSDNKRAAGIVVRTPVGYDSACRSCVNALTIWLTSPDAAQAMGVMRCRWMCAAWAMACQSPPHSSPRTSRSWCLSSVLQMLYSVSEGLLCLQTVNTLPRLEQNAKCARSPSCLSQIPASHLASEDQLLSPSDAPA